MSFNFISTNEELRQGDVLMSHNHDFKAVFQTDSNFVVYKWTPIWASGTWNQDARRIVLQDDSNLVMYNKSGKQIWSTDTGVADRFSRLRLTMTNDGNLLLDNDGKRVWNSGPENTAKLVYKK